MQYKLNISLPSLHDSVITEKEIDLGRNAQEIIYEWSRTTTSHGFPHIIASRSRVLKVIWTIGLLMSIGVCAYMLARCIMQYLEYDVTTTIIEVEQPEILLPQISLCNVNTFASPEAYEYLRNYYNTKYNVSINSFEDFSELLLNNTIHYDTDWLLYQTYAPDFNRTLRDTFDQDAMTMFRYCTINNTTCDSSDFVRYYDPQFGNCYKFNSGFDSNNNPVPLRYINREGNGFGIQIFGGLSDRTYKYLYEEIYSGIMILIGDQANFPLKQSGILNPVMHAQIQLTKTIINSMPVPYGTCVSPATINTQLSRDMKSKGFNYNRQNCMVFCEQRQVINKFGCYDMRLLPLMNAPPCNNQSIFVQLTNFVYDYSDCYEDCPFECSTIEYDVSISYANYPSYNFYLNETLVNIDYYKDIFRTDNVTYEDFSQLASVYIYYDQLVHTEVSAKPALEIVDIISYMGGTLGLFIGISVLSFVEIVELGFNVTRAALRRHFNRKLQENMMRERMEGEQQKGGEKTDNTTTNV